MLRPFRAAVAFLSRVPAGVGAAEERDLGRALGFFPLVGMLLGATLLGIAWVAYAWLSPGLLSVALVAWLALITGGLHLDGLADLFDGLGGGGGDRARMLEIMRRDRTPEPDFPLKGFDGSD